MTSPRSGGSLAGHVATARLVVANGNLVRLAICFGAWITGEFATLVVLSVVAYEHGGAGAVGVIGAIRVLPTALLAPLGSVLADRLPRPRVLMTVHVTWAALMLALVAAVDASVIVIYALVAVAAVTASPFKASVNALLPQVVDRPEELVAANSVYSFVEASGTLLGPLLAAAMLAVAPIRVAFVAIAAVYATAAVVTRGIYTPFQRPRLASAGPHRLLEPLRGFLILAARPGLRLVFLLFAAQTFMRGLLNVFVVVAAISLLGLGEPGAGTLLSALGVGGLVGSLTSLVVARGRRAAVPFTAGMLLWGLPVVVIGAWPHPVLAWLALGAVGLGNAVADVSGYTLFQRVVPDHLMGRAFGAFWGAVTLSLAAGSLLAPVLISTLTLRGAMIASGGALVALVLLIWPSLRALDAQVNVPAHEFDVLRSVPLFAPLSQVAVERLAREARWRDAARGSDIVCEGDVGDAFYVVERGRLRVSAGGRRLHDLGPGDFFGEIALLRQVPRTATVTALSKTRLLSLDAPSFVAAVTGHRVSDAIAIEAVEERLRAG